MTRSLNRVAEGVLLKRVIAVLLVLFVLACEVPEEAPTPTPTLKSVASTDGKEYVPSGPFAYRSLTPTAESRPAATSRPTPMPRPASGTGISFQDFAFGFEYLGSKFRAGTALDDNDKVVDYYVWDAPIGSLLRVEAWGPRSDLTKMEMTVGLGDPNRPDTQALYIDMFMDSIFLEWTGSPWVIDNALGAVEGRYPTITKEGKRVRLKHSAALNWLSVEVTPAP